jgi:NAD(P)-dependent dehydrogenase (short-subunit alcohol dehydrogenase family)
MEKSIWKDAVALITGGGSGIGKALALAITKRGTKVIVTDINLSNAQLVAEECGESATSFSLDVTDASAVEKIIKASFEKYGHLDFIFNNAGIAIAGEAQELSASHWDRIIDVNIKGVINGALAAYPLMIKQGAGYIINTASLAGLGPAPFLTPYGMTKHAVVGFSTSLRLEAANYGVKVNVLCPAAIETPLLDSDNPRDLPSVPWVPDMRRFLTSLGGPPYPVDKFAEEALDGIQQNKGVIVIPRQARLTSRIGRFIPSLVEKLGLKAVQVERSFRK